jgi:hypothetical protein
MPSVGGKSNTIAIKKDLEDVWILGQGLGVNRAVGVVPAGNYDQNGDWQNSYFQYHGQYGPEGEDVGGISMPGVYSVLTEEGLSSAVAHEIGHSFGLCRDQEEYDLFPKTPRAEPTKGYWVGKELEIADGYCFMGAASEASYHQWICEYDYENLFRELCASSSDPALLLICGGIDRQGQVKFDSFLKADTGTYMNPIPGDYSVDILGPHQEVLSSIPFYTDFKIHIDPIGIFDTDEAAFTLAIPYIENAEKIRIKQNNLPLTEVDINIMLLDTAIDSIPDTGFMGGHVNNRKALHNKTRELEEMISKGHWIPARNKLEYDIRDKISKWLIDGYQVSSRLQMTKEEVIKLIDDIFIKLFKY